MDSGVKGSDGAQGGGGMGSTRKHNGKKNHKSKGDVDGMAGRNPRHGGDRIEARCGENK